ncbi:hypothetical protein [Sphingomonas sp. CFBP 13720]|uniref:hypothetical protein n=1 Tax=Sphingomonas sp. CFBP 13720 TaxID=2775302 RepID=UPI0017809C88|nr:hypothetical protein [Sphingomonas sp. CFBP 13720]MBD8679654.1 hypothetical protein [Sphingomonas sp. CFBP 13720]
MRKGTVKPGEETLVDGITIKNWDAEWQMVKQGFTKIQSELGHEVGLWAAKRGDEFVYIAAAQQVDNGGLRAGLARVRNRPQTNNRTDALRKIKDSVDSLDAWILKVDKSRVFEIINDLKEAMIDLHDPEWNKSPEIIAAAEKADLKRRLF